jgi:hypothetical protein
MKNYTSLASTPHTDYTKFTGGAGPTDATDNTAIKRLDNHEMLQTREIHRNSNDNSKLGNYFYPYTSENIININGNDANRLLENEKEERQPIVLPFYIPIIDIIISNDLSIDIVDHSIRVGVDTKESILCSGKIRKYRVIGDVKECNFIIEMENNTEFHVKKKGIMMRTSVHDDLRRHIIKIMVNYIEGGGMIDGNTRISTTSSGDCGGNTVVVKPKKKWFHKFACFSSTPD